MEDKTHRNTGSTHVHSKTNQDSLEDDASVEAEAKANMPPVIQSYKQI